MSERRRRPRFPLENLRIHLRVKRGLFSREWVAVKPFDFSRTGVGFKTDELLTPGEHIVVSLRLELEFGDVLVEEADGIVRHSEKECSCFNYGVEFDLSSRRMKREEIQYSLSRMEVLLERYNDILLKMQGVSAPSA